MFAFVAAGRMVSTLVQQVDESKFVFSVEDALNVNHLCVFLTGTAPFPPGHGSVLYVAWPPYNNWEPIGFLTQEKPSAIFRLQNVTKYKTEGILPVAAQVGISIEPIETLQAMFLQQKQKDAFALTRPTTPWDPALVFARNMLQHLYNYVTSFSELSAEGIQVIPTVVIQKWVQSFEKKLQLDNDFLKRMLAPQRPSRSEDDK